MSRFVRALTAVIATVLLVAGCGHHAGGPVRAGQVGSGASTPAPTSVDPPVKFRQDKAVRLAGAADLPLPVLLYRTTVVVAAADHLSVVDALSGKVRSTLRPPDEPAGTRAAAPVLAQVDGHTLAVAALPVTKAGRRAVDLLALDISTGQTLWTLPIDVTATVAVPVGVHDRTLLLTAGGTTYAVDLAARKVVWSKEFAADLVIGDVVVGGGAHGAVALSISDGGQRWTSRAGTQVYVRSGGPDLIVTTGGSAGAYFFDLLDPATGTPRYSSGGGGSAALQCRYDEQAAIVCWQEANGSRWVGGFDPTTGQSRWQLPDDPASPTVTQVWHGAVYGYTAAGPVVLDAHTGADRNTSPGLAPYLVDEYVGIARSGADLDAYPAAS